MQKAVVRLWECTPIVAQTLQGGPPMWALHCVIIRGLGSTWPDLHEFMNNNFYVDFVEHVPRCFGSNHVGP
jgi:hypothetical protein